MLSFVLAIVLLNLAGHYEAHYHTNLQGAGDRVIRKGAGLFVLAGVIAAIPSLVAAPKVYKKSRSIAGWIVGCICIVLGVGLEILISIAPSPWFVF